MTIDQIEDFVEAQSEDGDAFLSDSRWEAITPKHSQRKDIHAFVTLDKLIPADSGDLIAWAGHDEISLEPSLEEIAPLLTEDIILDLLACGVRFEVGEDCMKMFI